MECVNINDIQSIMVFFLDGVDDYSSFKKADKNIFVQTVKEMTQDLNQFDVKKHKCALCGGSAHNFDSRPEVTQSDLKGTYICL